MDNPLKKWRAETGFTRAEAATALGILYSFYCQIEAGTQPPTPRVLAALVLVGNTSDVCPTVDPADFLHQWARYDAARRRALLARRRDSPAAAAA